MKEGFNRSRKWHGLAAAKAFAEAGATVVLADINEPTAQAEQIEVPVIRL